MNSLSNDASTDSTELDSGNAPETASEAAVPAMWIGVVSLFPEMFDALTQQGVVGRAVEKQRIALEFWNRGIMPLTATAASMTAPMVVVQAC